jgi:hypothetical protein
MSPVRKTIALTATLLVAVERLQDLRLVRPPQAASRRPPGTSRDIVSWGIALFEYLLQVRANPHRVRGGLHARAAEDPAGGDHARGVRALRDALHGRASSGLPLGGLCLMGAVYFIFSLCTSYPRHLRHFMGGLAKIARERGHR